MKRLLDSARAAERGDGRVVVVFGEPGSGKSVLMRELTRQVESERLRICLTRVYRGDAAAPYAPWRALLADQPDLRALIPAPLGDALPEAESSEALGRRCAARLIEFASQRPLILIFEQLDDADASSLALLEALAERLEGAALLLVLTMTPQIARSLMSAHSTTRLRMPASAVVVELEPITETDIRTHLAQQVPSVAAQQQDALAATLRRLSGGNGLLLSELTRALADGEIDAAADISDLEHLPTSLMGVAQHRVALLAGAAVDTLELAALAGEVIQPELLFDLLPRSADDIVADLEEAITRGLLADTSEGGLRFRHGIFREALIRRQSSLRRRARHQQIANWLNAQPAARPEDIGQHAELAGDYALAYDACLRAGEAAEHVFALPEAAHDYRRALALGGRLGLDDASLDELRLRIADALMLTDRDGARREITRVVTRAELRNDQRVLAAALQRRAVLLYEAGQPGAALAILEDILPRLAAGADHRAHALALTYAGYCYGSTNDLPALDHVAGELAQLAARVAQPAYRAMALQFEAGVLVARGEPTAAPRLARESVEIMAELGRYDRAADYAAVAMMRVDIPANLARPEEVDALLRRGEELQALCNERLGATLPYEPAFLALRFLRGDWAHVRQVLSEQEAQRDEMPGVVRDILHNVAADLALAEGRTQDADAVSALIAPMPAAWPGEHSLPQWLNAAERRVSLALRRGDLDDARAWLVALERALARRQHAPGTVLTALIGAQLSLAHGQPERTAQLTQNVLGAARATGNLLVALRAQRLRAAALRQRGEFKAAFDESQLAAAEAETARLPHQALLGWLDAAEAAAELPDLRAAAAALVERCLTGSALLGAFAARQQALHVHERLQAVRSTWPAGVTAREVDVLRLLAQGMADRAIAERLFISPRTVTTHVGNLLGKTATANRTELAMWAVQQGLVAPEHGASEG